MKNCVYEKCKAGCANNQCQHMKCRRCHGLLTLVEYGWICEFCREEVRKRKWKNAKRGGEV